MEEVNIYENKYVILAFRYCFNLLFGNGCLDTGVQYILWDSNIFHMYYANSRNDSNSKEGKTEAN